MGSLRRTVYWKFGEPITLAFMACVGDQHPELLDDAPSPPQPKAPTSDRSSAFSDRNIRRALGKGPARTPNQVGFDRTLRRIMRGGA
jgi:hypothetical protein